MNPRSARSIVLAAAIASAGCAARGARGPALVTTVPTAAGAPAARIRVVPHLGWPYRLSRVIVVVDGAVLKNERFSPGDAPPAAIAATTELAPGEHTVQLLAETQVSLTAAGPECAVTLRSATAFAAAAGAPAEITADLYLRGAEQRFQDRLHVRTGVRAPALDAKSARGLPAGEEARCRREAPAEAAVCLVEAAVAAAVRERDVVEVLCNREKLDPMRVLLRMRDEARARAEGTVPTLRRPIAIAPDDAPPDPAPADLWAEELEQRERVRVLEQRIVALGREAEQCVSADPEELPSVAVTADEACFARLPELDGAQSFAALR